MNKNVSIKDVADYAGVSVATISRVMNNKGGYSAETEKKVLKAIEECAYVPNLIAKGLRTNKTPLIGVIIPDIVNEFYSSLVLNLQMALFEEGYLTTICNTNESRKLEIEHLHALAAQNVSGLVLVSGSSYKQQAEYSGMPTVYIDRRPKNKNKEIVYVESDNVLGGYLATKELLECGCKRIGFVTDMLSESSKTARFRGYCKALDEAGIAIEPSFIMKVKNVKIDDAYEVVSKTFEQEMGLDGIMCATDVLAIGASLAAKNAGLKIPEDIKVTGFDDIGATTIFNPTITTVHQYSDRMASIVAEMLISLIKGKELSKRKYSIPVSLIKRESTRGKKFNKA